MTALQIQPQKGLTQRATPWLLLLPGIIGIVVSFLIPMFWVIRMSFNENGESGRLITTVSPANYIDALSNSFNWTILVTTLQLGFIVAVVSTLLSYPIALFLVKSDSKWKGLLIALAVAPLLVSAVVRTYGWIALLGDQGVVNSLLITLGFTDTPLALTNNFTGSSIAMIEIMMPYAILAMMTGFGRINTTLEEAANSLGANKMQTFARVTFPLSIPGVLTSLLLTFVLTISSFVTPSLLGGGRVFLLATEIYDQATETLNWPLAATLSVILLVVFGLIITLYQRATRKLGD